MTHTILVADDEDTLRTNLARVLQDEGFDVIACADGKEAAEALKANAIDVLITDLRMPGMRGMDLIDHTAQRSPETTIMVMTAFGEVETAVEAMRKGARDYLCKPLNFDELIVKLKRFMADSETARQNRVLREQIRRTENVAGVVADSPPMTMILDTLRRIAHTTSNVLICGESGTGKEVLARVLHHSGITKDKPFVAVDCGALVDSLIESQLFGYRKGSFTGASSDRMGYFEVADGGTLFLDEIGNLTLKSQAVLLRAIEEKTITRVGDNRPHPVNIRIVAATNRDLEKGIESGEFREDLYFRLNVVRITVPPLRERPEDILPLVWHFTQKYNAELKCNCPGFTARATEAMMTNRWRGNVRELENVVERALIFAGDRPIDVQDLPFVPGAVSLLGTMPADLRAAIREFERQHLLRIIARCSNDKNAAAEMLGIALSSLYRKLEEFGIARTCEELGAHVCAAPAKAEPEPSDEAADRTAPVGRARS